MISKVVITDNENTPIRYLPKVFENATEFEFKPGVNIIVGKNGSGKTTLMKLLEYYLIVDKTECSVGAYNSNISRLKALRKDFPNGAGIYADYRKNIFRLCHKSEKKDKDFLSNFNAFGEYFTQMRSSTGEGVMVAMNSLFDRMFSNKAKLSFDYERVCEYYPAYGEYIEGHRIDGEEWTVLMDEPDRNLDIENIDQIKNILSFHKEHTQIIAVVHNPLLIYALSKVPDVNFVEMTRGYVNKIKKLVKALI